MIIAFEIFTVIIFHSSLIQSKLILVNVQGVTVLKYFEELFVLAQVSQFPTFSFHFFFFLLCFLSPAKLFLAVTSWESFLFHQIAFKDYPYSLKCLLRPLSLLQTRGINFASEVLHCRRCYYTLYLKNTLYYTFQYLCVSLFLSRLCSIFIIVSQQHITQQTAQGCKQWLLKFIVQLLYQTDFEKIVGVSVVPVNETRTQLREIR